MTQAENFEDAVAYCLAVPKFTKKNKPEVTRAFLQFLHVEQEEACVIHVAGTNGKGSVCAFLQSIGTVMNKTVATFTSPHLCDIRERICVNGKMISKEDFFACFLEVMEKLKEFQSSGKVYATYHPTFFELLFFLAMTYFSKVSPQVVILETGLGGRLDATNAVSKKDICVITEIGYDHMEYLGNTLQEIAGEKAGIIKESVPVVFLDKNETVKRVLVKTARDLSSPYILVSKDSATLISNSDKDIDFLCESRYYGDVRFSVRSKAVYQMENAMLAIRTAEQLWHEELTLPLLQKGISGMHHEGRMEEIIPGVYLDGAHNEDGIIAFLDTVKRDGLSLNPKGGRRQLLFSVVRDKQYELMVRVILESHLFSAIGIAPIGNERGLSEEELSRIFAGCDYVTQYTSVCEAVTKMLSDKGGADCLYVTGSLYLVGQIKDLMRDED